MSQTDAATTGGRPPRSGFSSGEHVGRRADQVEILGHMLVPEVDDLGGSSSGAPGGLHLEFMLGSSATQAGGAMPVQRRFKDFDRLNTALIPIAKRARCCCRCRRR